MISQNALGSEDPNGDPIATLSICLYDILLNIKYYSLVAKDRIYLNSLFFKPRTMPLCLKIFLVQIMMVSPRAMLAKTESISKLPRKLLKSCSTISMQKLNKSLTVYLLAVNGSKIGAKYYANLHVGVLKLTKLV